MEGVTTMTASPPLRPKHGGPWTIEDLLDLPGDDDRRYEIDNGRLLVVPQPTVRHCGAATLLCRLLDRAAPDHLLASTAGFGINIYQRRTYYVPDIVVLERDALMTPGLAIEPAVVRLVVEVLSPHNRGHDLVRKRREYARVGIPLYWIVDRDKSETMTVLTLDETTNEYVESAVLRPGRRWTTNQPYPFSLDLAEIF
jgi:Uma2 family endonuclease